MRGESCGREGRLAEVAGGLSGVLAEDLAEVLAGGQALVWPASAPEQKMKSKFHFILGLSLIFSLVIRADGFIEADSKTLTMPILFCKQFNYNEIHIYDTFYKWQPGGGIYLLENPADPVEQHRIRPIIDAKTAESLGEGVYFDPSLSYDAKKILFCFKGKPRGSSTIYEIGIDGKGLRKIINRDLKSNSDNGADDERLFHDVKPAYLPDGRIVCTSTGYRGLVPCNNSVVAILHVMNPDGSDMHTISVNNLNEFDPVALADGRILFSRWEYVDRNALVIQSLWTVMPDGCNETAVFGNNMVFPEAILQARPIPGNDRLIVATFTPHNASPRGTIAIIDTLKGKNGPAAIFNFESPNNPTFDRGESCDPWPLSQDMILYSGIPDAADAPQIPRQDPEKKFPKRSHGKLNALMLIDRSGKKLLVHSDPAIDLHNPIPLVPRPIPRVPPDMTKREKQRGSFFVSNLYASMPEVKKGSIKWLRVLEESSRISGTPPLPPLGLNQKFPISAALAWSAKIYHGIVPVEADGSVFFEAPSGRALYFQLLDQDYRMIRGMRTFIQAAPGVTRSCTGCHDYDPPKVIQRWLQADSTPKPLQAESWGSGWLDYTDKIQPVLNAKCVRCHGGFQGLAKGLDLSGGWTDRFNISYDSLSARRQKIYTADVIGGICTMNGTAHWACQVFAPYQHGSGKAILADVLLSPSHRDILTKTEKELIFAWMDSNGMYFGTWDYTAVPPRSEVYAKTVNAVKKVMLEAGCSRCHGDKTGEIKRFDNWINLENPQMSLILRAPLPVSTTAPTGYGLGLCRVRWVDSTFSRRGLLYSLPGYPPQVLPLEKFPTQQWPAQWPPAGEPVISFQSVEDPYYQKLLKLLIEAKTALLEQPRIDMPTAHRLGKGIIEGQIRQIQPPSLPASLPVINGKRDEHGCVRIYWQQPACMIGIKAEIHRGVTPAFSLNPSSRLGITGRSEFFDIHPPSGKLFYAVVFLNEAAAVAPACQTGQTSPLSNSAYPPPAHSKPVRAAPVYLMLEQ